MSDPTTPRPAAQAGALADRCPFCGEVMNPYASGEHHSWVHPTNWCLLSTYAVTDLEKWNQRRTPAPAVAPPSEVGAAILDAIRAEDGAAMIATDGQWTAIDCHVDMAAVAKRLLASLATREGDGWRTMESAPTDGTRFIGKMRSGLVGTVHLQEYIDGWAQNDKGGWEDSGKRRHGWSWETSDSHIPCNPIGWMPLPGEST